MRALQHQLSTAEQCDRPCCTADGYHRIPNLRPSPHMSWCGHTDKLVTGHCGLQMVRLDLEGQESGSLGGKCCATTKTTGGVGQCHDRAGVDMAFTRHQVRVSGGQSGF